VSSPALECPSRLCLLQQLHGTSAAIADGGFRATCTAECKSDKDCNADPTYNDTSGQNKYCSSGFVCAVAVTTGPFRCRNLCVCRDDLIAGQNQDPLDGGTIVPCACSPTPSMNPYCSH
jgi:hypothetical protein